jgi:hypothetical protein
MGIFVFEYYIAAITVKRLAPFSFAPITDIPYSGIDNLAGQPGYACGIGRAVYKVAARMFLARC